MQKKILKGKVISDINEKTVVVLVERKYQHPFLKKIIKKKKKKNTKNKRFKVLEENR